MFLVNDHLGHKSLAESRPKWNLFRDVSIVLLFIHGFTDVNATHFRISHVRLPYLAKNASFSNTLREKSKLCSTVPESGYKLRNFFLPTVIKATAIKKYNIFASSSSYSVVFHVKKIFKYENRVFENDSHKNINNQNFYQISSQEENSTRLNTNSVILLDHLKQKNECDNGVEVGKDYFLFLNSLDPSLKREERRYFFATLNESSFAHLKGSTNGSLQISMPVFEATSSAPKLARIGPKIEARIQNILCFMDPFCLASKEQEKFEDKKEIAPASRATLKPFPLNVPKSYPPNKQFNTKSKTKQSLGRGNSKLAGAKSALINTRDQYIKCNKTENTCQNGGECFITNENFYLFKSSADKIKITYCM